jgi:pre-mRNA-processing factor 6
MPARPALTALSLGAASLPADSTGSLRCHTALAELQAFQGAGADARATLAAGAARHRPDARFLRQWALLEKRAGDMGAAGDLFRRAADADPRDERTWLAWGLLEKRRGRGEEAARCWRAGLRVSPLNPHLWQVLAKALWEMGRVEEARGAFAEGLKNAPNNQPLLLEWALAEAGAAGGEPAALRILRLGAGASEPHEPLLAAWAQVAGRMGLEEEAGEVRVRLEAAQAAEAGRRRRQRADAEAARAGRAA